MRACIKYSGNSKNRTINFVRGVGVEWGQGAVKTGAIERGDLWAPVKEGIEI